jgi:hypothetical protein
MAKLPLIVKRRDNAGKVAEVLCDTVEDARKTESIFTTWATAMSGSRMPKA